MNFSNFVRKVSFLAIGTVTALVTFGTNVKVAEKVAPNTSSIASTQVQITEPPIKSQQLNNLVQTQVATTTSSNKVISNLNLAQTKPSTLIPNFVVSFGGESASAKSGSVFKFIWNGSKWLFVEITTNEFYNVSRYCATDNQACRQSIINATNEFKNTEESNWFSPKAMESWVQWAYPRY